MQIKELLEAHESFTQEYLIGKYSSYDVDVSVFSTPLGSTEPTWAANIVGVGIGEKYQQGIPAGQRCLRVYVAEKVPTETAYRRMPYDLNIGSTYHGTPTDIVAVGRPTNFQVRVLIGGINTSRIRPAPGGFSIGNTNDPSAGTLGGLVKDKDDRSNLYVLSNNHVIARENQASTGEPVVQPARFDGGGPGDEIGHYEQRNDRVDTSGGRNKVDAAVAKVTDAALVSANIPSIGRPSGVMQASEKRWVIKSGRTTAWTRGYVYDVNFTFTMAWGGRLALFEDQLVIKGVPSPADLSARTAGFMTPFSAPGDSGSLIIDERTGYAVDLLFAGNTSYDVTYANKIENVLKQLSVELAT